VITVTAAMRYCVAIAGPTTTTMPIVSQCSVSAPMATIDAVTVAVTAVPTELSHRKRDNADGDTEDETEDEYAL
jgi:hypothetical protein